MALITDSCCVKVISKSKLIVAVGNRLIIHDQNKKTLQCPLKPQNKIHKISASTIGDEHLIVIAAAGREILYVELKDDVFQALTIYETADWVCSLHFLEKPREFIFLVKHNIASLVVVDPVDLNTKVVAKASLMDKVTNYSSLISGANWNEALIFCGTALGDLIVWSPKSNPGQLLSRISAHNGVIFSIDRQNDFLVTTSDDRSLKLWVLQSTPDTCVIAAKKTLFGHTGRIFCCKIITHAGDPYLISAGDDGTICVWNLAGSEKLAWQSQIVWKKKCTATIWSVDYDAATKTIYATTSTGNIFNYKFQSVLVPEEAHVEETVGPKAVIKYKSHCTWKAFLLQDYTLAIFLDSAILPQFYRIAMDSSCSLLKSLDNFIVLASKAKLTLIDVNFDDYELKEVDLSGSLANSQSPMIRSLHILNKQELIFCTSTGICGIFVIPELTVKGPKCLLPLCSERFTTSALKHGKCLLLADRCGNLHLFVENGESENTVLDPKHTLKHLHGNMGITNIIPHTVGENNFTVKTTGHDNTIKMVFVDQSKHQLIYWNTEKIPIAWVEKVVSHPSGQTLVFGFNSSHFVGYRLGADDLLFQYQCGGGHRDWDLTQFSPEQFGFGFIQRGNFKMKNFDIDANWTSAIQTTNVKWHSDSVNEMHIIETAFQTYFLTAGEDNLIKLLRLNQDLSMTVVTTMYQHISAVKCLKVSFDTADRTKLIVISGGGRSQICVTILIIGQNVYHKEECQFMLHSTDSERKRKGVAQDLNFDPETRFMCVDLEEMPDGSKKLYVGCSDGFVRMFLLAENGTGYTIVPTGEFYYGRCCLRLKVLRVPETGTVLLTMATDGLVNFYATDQLGSEKCRPFYVLKHHDSGVNCFDCVKICDEFVLATGGDDERISTTRFKITTSYGFQHIATAITSSIHSAQVTGVLFVQGKLLTTSVDQTVAVLDAHDLTKERQDFSCIADIKGLRYLKYNDKDYTIVYGSGLEMIENKW